MEQKMKKEFFKAKYFVLINILRGEKKYLFLLTNLKKF